MKSLEDDGISGAKADDDASVGGISDSRVPGIRREFSSLVN